MAELPDGIRQPHLRPVAVMLGPRYLYETLLKGFNSFPNEEKLDFAHLNSCGEIEYKKEPKTLVNYKLKGILKANWVMKTRALLPATILLTVDWSGRKANSLPLEGPDWKSKENSLLAELRKIKEKMRGAIVKVAVIIFLNEKDDVYVEEKVGILRKISELEPKGILITKGIPESVNLANLNKYLWDAALLHYKDEVHRYKRLKSRASKEIALPEIAIRYEFKLGYLNELRQDMETAMNHYKKVYNALRAISPNEISYFEEIRAVADWVVYRLFCILLSKSAVHGKVKEAISMFKDNVKAFAAFSSRHSLPFETSKWLATHFIRFGGLFELLASDSYSPSNLWTHPGFYFQVGAMHILEQMHGSVEDPNFIELAANWEGLTVNVSVAEPVYLGQAKQFVFDPLHVGVLDEISRYDQVKIIKTLAEAQFSHLNYAVDLLFRVIKFYRTCIPMPRHVDMISFFLSDLYSKKGDVPLSYKMKSDIWKKFRDWTVITQDLVKSLRSYSACVGSLEEKVQWVLYEAAVEPGKSAAAIEIIEDLIRDHIASVQVEMPSELLEAKAKFLPKTIETYEAAELTITIQSKLPGKIVNCKMSFLFDKAEFNQDYHSAVDLEDNTQFEYKIRILANSNEALQLNLEHIIISYEPVSMSYLSFKLPAKACLTIIPYTSKLITAFEHYAPAYIAEEYIVKLLLTPISTIKSGKLFLMENRKEEPPERRASVDRFTDSLYQLTYIQNSERISTLSVTLPELHTEPYYMDLSLLFYEEGNYTFKLCLDYEVVNSHGLEFTCADEYELDFNVLPPFQATVKLSQDYANEVLIASFWSQKHISKEISIYSLHIKANGNIQLENEELLFEEPYRLSEQEIISHSFPYTKVALCKEIVGDIVIKWSRKSPPAICRLPFTCFMRAPELLSVDVTVPATVKYLQSFSMAVSIKNLSEEKLDLGIVMHSIPVFLVGGRGCFRVDIVEGGKFEWEYTLLATEPGYFELPVVNVKNQNEKTAWRGRILVYP